MTITLKEWKFDTVEEAKKFLEENSKKEAVVVNTVEAPATPPTPPNRWKPWSDEELNKIREILKIKPNPDIKSLAIELGRTLGAVRQVIYYEKRNKPRKKRRSSLFTKEDDEFIIKNYKQLGPKKIAELLKKPKISLEAHVYKLRKKGIDVPLFYNKIGSNAGINIKKFLIDNGVKLSSLRTHLNDPYSWSENEERYLKENYNRVSINDMAIHLSRTPRMIKFKLRDIGLLL